MRARVARGLALLLLACGAGCSTGPPSQGERAHITAGSRALVLVRLEATKDGAPYRTAQDLTCPVDDFALGLTQFGDRERARRRALDAVSRREGWVYFLLEPETYYLTVSGPADIAPEQPPPVFRLEVPEGARVVYAGSLRGNVQTQPGIFFGSLAMGFDAEGVSVHDESDEARALVAQHLPEFAPPATVLLTAHEEGATRIIRTQ